MVESRGHSRACALHQARCYFQLQPPASTVIVREEQVKAEPSSRLRAGGLLTISVRAKSRVSLGFLSLLMDQEPWALWKHAPVSLWVASSSLSVSLPGVTTMPSAPCPSPAALHSLDGPIPFSLSWACWFLIFT